MTKNPKGVNSEENAISFNLNRLENTKVVSVYWYSLYQLKHSVVITTQFNLNGFNKNTKVVENYINCTVKQ